MYIMGDIAWIFAYLKDKNRSSAFGYLKTTPVFYITYSTMTNVVMRGSEI